MAILPSILTPKEPSLPSIRETAVRMQADLLLVLRLSTDVYEKWRLFQASQAKAFSTCEAFLPRRKNGPDSFFEHNHQRLPCNTKGA